MTAVYSDSGLFVALEGGEGAGKSTQARLLQEWLVGAGREVVLTFEPGDTLAGRRIREIVLDPGTGELDDRTEALLYAADKAEHVAGVVWPALQRGAVVVTDRYVDSTLAYQGAGRSIPSAELEHIARWATGGLRPHLTVLLDLAPEDGLKRFHGRDRIEGESHAFHCRVRDAFRHLAETDPGRYLVLDATRPADDIAARIRARIEQLLPAPDRAVAQR